MTRNAATTPVTVGRLVAMLAAALVHAGPLAAAPASPPPETQAAAREKLALQGLTPTPDRLVQYAAQGDATIVGWLLAAGVPATSVEPRRRVTALHNAAAQGHERVALQLLNAGAAVDAIDWQGNTPLALAAYWGHAKLVNLLLAQGAAVNPTRPGVASALSLAVQAGRMPIVRSLLAAGATQQPNVFGELPVDIAARINRPDLVQLLQTGVAGPALASPSSSSP